MILRELALKRQYSVQMMIKKILQPSKHQQLVKITIHRADRNSKYWSTSKIPAPPHGNYAVNDVDLIIYKS